ncbi:MAG: transposase [Planctomycetota bacterium]
MESPDAELGPHRGLLVRLFEDPENALRASASDAHALKFLERVRWPAGIVCSACGSGDVVFLAGQHNRMMRRRRCRSCKHQFSPTSGTPLTGTRVPPSAVVLGVAMATQGSGQQIAAALMEAGLSKTAASNYGLKLTHMREWLDRSEAELVEPAQLPPTKEVAEVAVAPPEAAADVRSRPRTVHAPAVLVAAVVITAAAVLWLNRPIASSHAAEPSDVAVETHGPDGFKVAHWMHGGMPRTYHTKRLDGEAIEAWEARHTYKIQRLLAAYPPDAPD